MNSRTEIYRFSLQKAEVTFLLFWAVLQFGQRVCGTIELWTIYILSGSINYIHWKLIM